MRTVVLGWVLAALLAGLQPAIAGPQYGVERARHAYLVTLLLRAPGAGVTVKLVHAVRAASGPDEALGAVSASALLEYPGYSVLDSLVSPAPAGDCGVSI